jgi:hypothetical protein
MNPCVNDNNLISLSYPEDCSNKNAIDCRSTVKLPTTDEEHDNNGITSIILFLVNNGFHMNPCVNDNNLISLSYPEDGSNKTAIDSRITVKIPSTDEEHDNNGITSIILFLSIMGFI